MFFDASKLLVDNIRITNNDDNENESITTYAVVSDENSPVYIRSLGIDTEGRSHVLYTAIFEEKSEDGSAPGYQASSARLDLMYRHRYQDISQIGFYEIVDEDDFYNVWRDMPENPNTKEIDEVVVIMHGMYYAMMISSERQENLTVSPDGKVGSDPSALRISDLPVRNIETIRLSSCKLESLEYTYIILSKYEGHKLYLWQSDCGCDAGGYVGLWEKEREQSDRIYIYVTNCEYIPKIG